MSDISCSIQPLKKNQRRGTLDECIKKRQIRYYGVQAIDMNEITVDKIMAKITETKRKIKKLTVRMMNSKKQREIDMIKMALEKATNDMIKYNQLIDEINKKQQITIEEDTPQLSTEELLNLYAPTGGTISCGIRPLKKNERAGTLEECIKKRQIRRYGLEKVDLSDVKKAKPGKNELTREKIQIKISTLRGKVKNLTSKIMTTKKEDEREQFKFELEKATNELAKYRELYAEMEAPKGGAKRQLMRNKDDFTSNCFNGFLNMKKGELNKIVKSMDKTIPVSKLKKAQLLCVLLNNGQQAAMQQVIESLEPEAIQQVIESLEPEAIQQVIESLEPEAIQQVIESLEPEAIQQVIESLDWPIIQQVIESLEPETKQQVIESLEPAKQQEITIDEPRMVAQKKPKITKAQKNKKTILANKQKREQQEREFNERIRELERGNLEKLKVQMQRQDQEEMLKETPRKRPAKKQKKQP
jgi:flavoprotein